MSQIKIEQLTDEQIAKFSQHIKKWKDIGLCTEPSNRKEAEKSINKSYEIAGLKKPKKIVWCGSPLSQGLVRAIILNKKLINNTGNSVRHSVGASVEESVGESVMDSVGESVWDSVGASVRASVGESVMDSVMDSVGESVWDSVGDSVGESVMDSVRASVRDSVMDSVWKSVRDSVEESVWDSVRASVRDSVMDSVWKSVRDSVEESVRNSVRNSVWGAVRHSVGGAVRHSVGGAVVDSVRASVRDSVMDSVRESVGASVMESVRDSVRESVGASVMESVVGAVRASMGDSVWDSVMDSVWDSVWESGYGQHDAAWLGFYDFFRNELNLLDETEELKGLTELSKNSGWFLPHENICWVSERHSVLNRNEDGRLHCLTGPAVLYPDGWSIYAINGVRLPAWIIENKEKITIEQIEKQDNSEIRRVMTDFYGLDRYIIDSGAKKIHQDKTGILYEKKIVNDESIVMVKVINSTPEPDGTFKNYFLRVPPDIKNATEAVAWTFAIDKKEYKPSIET